MPVVLDGGRVAGGHDGGPLPEDGIRIKAGKLRGVPSNGMMCSIEELGSSREMYPEAPENGIYIFDENAQVGADAVWMDMAPPADGRSFSEEEQAELYAAYGLSLADRPEGLEAQAVSTGLLDILLPVRDLAALERAEQNEGEVTRLSERYGVVGVHMFCPSTPDAAAHCRNFAPLYAIPEEAATGTSNGALTYYLYRRGLTAAGAENRFVQGEKMGKPSEILSRLTDGGDGVKVQVGGRAVLALRCELL